MTEKNYVNCQCEYVWTYYVWETTHDAIVRGIMRAPLNMVIEEVRSHAFWSVLHLLLPTRPKKQFDAINLNDAGHSLYLLQPFAHNTYIQHVSLIVCQGLCLFPHYFCEPKFLNGS